MRYITLIFAFLASILNGENWFMFRGNKKHTAYTKEKIIPPLTQVWEFQTNSPIVSSPAIVDGILCIGSRDSCFYAITADSGKLIWKCKTGGWIDCSPLVYEDIVYFTARDGYLYAFKIMDGTPKWRFRTKGMDCSSPIVVGDKIIFGSGYPNKEIYAIDIKTGRVKWKFQPNQMVYSSPATDDTAIYIGANDGYFYALNLDGSVKWSFPTRGGVYFSSPTVGSLYIYCAPGDYDKNCYAINKINGSMEWKTGIKGEKGNPEHNLPYPANMITPEDEKHIKGEKQSTFTYVSSPAAAHNIVYLVSGHPTQEIQAFNANTGGLLWKKGIGNAPDLGYASSPVIADSIVWVASWQGILYAFNAITGDSIWATNLGSNIISSPAIADGRLYIGTYNGKIISLKSAAGKGTGGAQSFEVLVTFPRVYKLEQNFPNPFEHSTIIKYQIPIHKNKEIIKVDVELKIYNQAGQLVRTLVNEKQKTGFYRVVWDGKDNIGKEVASGQYIYKIKAGEFKDQKKATITR